MQGRKPFKKHNMESKNRSIVTTSGASEPQRSAVGSERAGSRRSSSSDRRGMGVASQAPISAQSTSAEDAADLGPFAACDELELIGMKVSKVVEALKTFCSENRNVHQPIKKWASELSEVFKQFNPKMRKLRREVAHMDRELSDVHTSIRLRDFNESLNSSVVTPKVPTSDAETQSPCWWDVGPSIPQVGTSHGAIGPPSADVGTPQPGLWTEVVKKKGRADPRDGKAKQTREPTRTNIKTRPSAILVDPGTSAEFPALVKKIREGVSREIVGDSVIGLKKSKNGGLIIHVKGDQDQVEAVRAEVSKTAGPGIEAKSLQPKLLVEILDIDQWFDTIEVAEAVALAMGVASDTMKVVSLRKRYGGSQSALVLAPASTAKAVLAHGRLRVGLVNCRIRLSEQKVRCFRCLADGHMAKDCTGIDRKTCCRRCGEDGHYAKNCNATDPQVKVFRNELKAESLHLRWAKKKTNGIDNG